MYTFRIISEKDFDIIAKMECEIAVISYQEEAITDISLHTKRLRNAYENDPSGMIVAEKDGKIVGWLWMDKKQNYLTQETYINFRSLYINDEERGSTCSNDLLQYGIKYANSVKAKYIVGHVYTNNIAMRSVYKNNGFEAKHLTMQLDL